MNAHINKEAIVAYATERTDREEKAATKKGKRINRKLRIEKYTNNLIQEWEEALAQPDPVEIHITIAWKKSATWGSTPHARALVFCEDKSRLSFTATAGGCGYDKASTVVADLLNQCLRQHLIRAYTDGVEVPYGASPSYDRAHLPTFDGGVGMSCYEGDGGILASLGYTIKQIGYSDTYDAWLITKGTIK